MVVETINEKMCINKLITTQKDTVLVEEDVIVPDSKPDVLNTICTSGVICVSKKESLEEKVKLEGCINCYIMYLADDSNDKLRGISTNINFTESINVPKCKEGMMCKLKTKLKTIESKVINGRKVSVKAAIEVEINIYENEEMNIISDIQEKEDMQILKEDIKINSLLGSRETKIYAKENISIDNMDFLADILKINISLSGKETKVSYNKILTKAESEIKLMYLTEDNRIGCINSKIPIVGFIDMPNISEENIIDIDYEIKNVLLKPNSTEDHSIYVELEIQVMVCAYEEKQINLIQDLYCPVRKIEFNKTKIKINTNKNNKRETKQIKDRINIDELDGKKILDVDVIPTIEKHEIINNKDICTGELEVRFILSNDELQLDTRFYKIPFSIENEPITNKDISDIDIEIISNNFTVQDNTNVDIDVEMEVSTNSYMNSNINIIDKIEDFGEKELEEYSLIMYIVKKDDTLWKIAKKFNTTIDEIVKINEIEDTDRISYGQKIFIPQYQKVAINEYA